MEEETDVDVAPPNKAKEKPKERKVPRRDDELWKGILDDVFEDFLRYFIPNADELFDFSKKFSFLDKEFNRLFSPEKNAFGVRFVDKLVKVHLKDGKSKFILAHVEVQGNSSHEEFGLRMFCYWYRARDRHNVSITAFAVLIDDSKNYHPKMYKEEYLGTRLTYEFNTYKLLDQDEEKLRADPNPFAVVVLTVFLALKNKTINDDESLKQIKLDLTAELMKRKLGHAKRTKIMAFIAYYVNFVNPKMMIKFEKEVEQLTGSTTPMGVKEILLDRRKKEGIEQGRHEEALEIARELKKEGLKIEFIAKTTKLSVEEIEALV